MKKLLIIQFRTDASLPHERDIFFRDYPHLADRMQFVNAITEALPQDLSAYDGVILGGSGQFMLGEGDGEGTWKQKTFAFLDRLYETEIPVFGICLGFQLMALHQGARIVRDDALRETGTFRMYMTEAGKIDPLFHTLGSSFDAPFGHKETIVDPPEHLVTLAYTDRVSFNTFRVRGKKIWGTLSHPELDKGLMSDRLKLFPGYMHGQSIDDILRDFSPTPEASKMISNFLDQCDFADTV